MKPAAVALISVISTLFGVMGAFAWSRFSPYFGISPSRTILICKHSDPDSLITRENIQLTSNPPI